MDMKKILQAFDSVSTQPVEGSNDIKKFLSVVTEGANPHKVALPVQMAMQHFSKPAVKVEKKSSLLKQYFAETEERIAEELAEEQELKTQRLKMYSQRVANRVLMKESRVDEKSVSQAQAHLMAASAHNPKFAKKVGMKQSVAKEFNKADTGQDIKKLPKHVDEAPIDMTGDPNDPHIYGHEKANPMSLKGRIMQARAQLKELAQLAERDDLLAWEEICKKAKGGMFMGLEQNLEQIRHGISELAAKRKQGGVASRGIDKNIGEQNSLGNVLQWPEVVNKVNSAMKATGWKGTRKGDDVYMFSSKGQETDDQFYFVIIDNAGEGFFSYALGTVEDGDPHIDDAYRGQLPNTEASVSELINTIRDGFGLNEGLKNPKDNPCWKGYKPVGTKKKGGRTVPNCVPK